jgi:hypothetical protein
MRPETRYKEIISKLVELKLLEKFWDPELHPRVPGGTTKGGEFTFKGKGTTDVGTAELDPADRVSQGILGVPTGPSQPSPTTAVSTVGKVVKLDPEVLNVGGDPWNQAVARRLEYEYKRTKPDLDKLVDKIVGTTDTVPSGDDDEEEEEAPFVPEDRTMMSNDQQEQTEAMWMDKTYSEFKDSEVDNWYSEGGAYDEAASELVDEFAKTKNHTSDEWPEWATDAIDEVMEEYAEKGHRIPYTRGQLMQAISVDYTSQGYGGGSDPDLELDDDKLKEPIGWVDMPSLPMPGMAPVEPQDLLTGDMRHDLQKTLEKAFVKQAENDSGNMHPPDYLDDSIKELQEEYWNQKDDDEKFKHAQDYNILEPDVDVYKASSSLR